MSSSPSQSAAPEQCWLCLPGMLGHEQDWQGLFPTVWRRTRQLEALSPRQLFESLGGLDGDRTEKSLTQAGEYLVERCRPKTWLLGYSLGGRIALHALLAKPEHWAGAVLVGAHPGLQDSGQRVLRAQADKRWATRFASKEPWAEVLAAWQGQAVLEGQMPALLEARWQALRLAEEPKRQVWAQILREWSTSAQANLLPRLAELRCPVRWLTGEQDEKFSALAQLASAQNPLIEAKQIPAAGHRLPWQQPRRFWRELVDFCQSS